MLPELAQGHMTSEATFGTSIAVTLPQEAGPSSMPSLVGKTVRLVRFAFPCSLLALLIVPLVGSVLAYVFYWLAVVVVLVYYKFREVS